MNHHPLHQAISKQLGLAGNTDLLRSALSAVLDLHPAIADYGQADGHPRWKCGTCRDSSEGMSLYPCPTVRAITDQLDITTLPPIDRLPAALLDITTPADLADLLHTVMLSAGLTPSRMVYKAGIIRSQVYLLIQKGRRAVPRNGAQLLAFMHACRMRDEDISTVMDKWQAMKEARR